MARPMLTPPWLREALRRMEPYAGRMCDDDAWRARTGFFGPVRLPQAACGTLLLIGARSGLEAVLARMANPASRIFVVEADPGLRQRMLDLTDGQARVFATLEAAMAGDLPAGIDLARIDLAAFSPAVVATLAAGRRVDHLCGEASELAMDALALYRLCRERVRSFYFHLAEAGHAIAGDRPAPAVEVSVVVPAYNVAAWVEAALASLAAQTLQSLEVIVVDDGSTDATGAIADAWAAQDPARRRVVHQANAGCAAARMAGLAAARGEYVGFVDGDDWAEPPMFEELYRAAALRGAEIGQCGFHEAFEDGSRQDHPTAWGGDGPGGTTGRVADPRALLLLQPSIWRRIYRRDFLLRERIRFPEHIRRFDDLPFAFVSLARAGSVGIIPDCYYAYRQGRPGQDIAARDERLFVHFEIFEWLHAEIQPWADATVRRSFARLQLATHRFALGRIERRLRRRYLGAAVRQMHALGGGGRAALLWRLWPGWR
ncbi:MAG: hypothetical protein BGP12_12085 [Rhodospirillales bacterium 70-18]|nr:MAG: hypothetical protein BGP12_12085 [Rhodospirillales bacterium 70-18]